MTARNCCAAAADNNLLSLPDLPSQGRWCAAAGMPAWIGSVKTWRDRFSLFHFAHRID
jgi:hypothetical protein